MIKRSVNQEDKTLLNICAPNSRISKIRTGKTERIPRKNRSFVSVGDFSTLL